MALQCVQCRLPGNAHAAVNLLNACIQAGLKVFVSIGWLQLVGFGTENLPRPVGAEANGIPRN